MEDSETKTHEITLYNRTARNRFHSFILFGPLPVATIGLGVLFESPAMQWWSFVLTILLILGFATVAMKKNKGLTIEQARKRLDEIEANQ